MFSWLCQKAPRWKRGVPIVRDQPLPGFERIYVSDPFGNRLEFLEAIR